MLKFKILLITLTLVVNLASVQSTCKDKLFPVSTGGYDDEEIVCT